MIGPVVWSLQNLDSLRRLADGDLVALPGLGESAPLVGRIGRDELPPIGAAMVERGEVRILATDDGFDDPIAFLDTGDLFGCAAGDDESDPTVGAALLAMPETRIRRIAPEELPLLAARLAGPSVRCVSGFKILEFEFPLPELAFRPLRARLAAILLRLDEDGVRLPLGRLSRLAGALSDFVDWELDRLASERIVRKWPRPSPLDRARLVEVAAERFPPFPEGA